MSKGAGSSTVFLPSDKTSQQSACKNRQDKLRVIYYKKKNLFLRKLLYVQLVALSDDKGDVSAGFVLRSLHKPELTEWAGWLGGRLDKLNKQLISTEVISGHRSNNPLLAITDQRGLVSETMWHTLHRLSITPRAGI